MKKRLLFSLKLLLTGTLFAVLLPHIHLGTVKKFVHTANTTIIGIAMLLMLIQSCIAVLRWHIVLRFLGIKQPLTRSIGIFWTGMFFNSFLPSGIASDGMRAWLLQRTGHSTSDAIHSVLLDRLLGLFALVLIVCISIPFLHIVMGDRSLTHVFRWLAVSGVVGFFLLGYLNRLPISWQHFRTTQLLKHLSMSTHALWATPLHTSMMSVLALIGLLSQISVVYLLALSLHLPMGFLDCLVLFPPVILLTLFPLSIGGWGIREGAIVTLFGIVGVSTTAALSLSVVFGVMTLLVSLPGALCWLFYRKEKHNVSNVPSENNELLA